MNLTNKFRALRKQEGFTLVELIVVIAITAILAGVAVPAYGNYIEKSKRAADEQVLAAMNVAYASARMENGDFDMKNLPDTPAPYAKIDDEGNVTVEDENNDAFQRYNEGNGVFEYYKELKWDGRNGVFTYKAALGVLGQKLQGILNGTSYEGVMDTLLNAFDGISGYFAQAAGGEFGVLGYKDMLLGNASVTLTDFLGFGDVFEDLDNVMDKDDTAVMQGNAALLYFADDAKNHDRNAADVLKDVQKCMQVLGATPITNEEFNNSINDPDSYIPEAIRTEYENYVKQCNTDGKNPDVNAFLNGTCSSLGGAVNYSYRDMIAIERAAKQAGVENGNTSGISTLGAMYALAAGYYNNENTLKTNKNGTAEGFGDFRTVEAAVKEPDFWIYVNGADGQGGQGAADVQAYLDFMKEVSDNRQSIDMTSSNAFAELAGK